MAISQKVNADTATLDDENYPLLKADWDGNGTATWQEFGQTIPADYDADDDGLLEVASLAQLNAIRWDPDGDGAATADNETAYAAAFPNPKSGMGCNEDAVDAAEQVCGGYELTASLDFDTNGDGATNVTGDTYWNAGKGWTPIGTYTADFDGNGHTISNLFVNAPTAGAGLFRGIGGAVRNLGLIDVDVTGASGKNAGALAGSSSGSVSFSAAYGGTVANAGAANSGGLVGRLESGGSITSSWADVALSTSGTGVSGIGGLVGIAFDGSSIKDTYAAGSVAGPTGLTGQTVSGGLIGALGENAVVEDSYAVGRVTRNYSSGLAHSLFYVPTGVTTSYYDTTTTGQTTGGGVGKTTEELQSVTSNTGIYAAWSTDKWDFGDANHFPLLKADWDATSGATWQEFGEQDTPGSPHSPATPLSPTWS